MGSRMEELSMSTKMSHCVLLASCVWLAIPAFACSKEADRELRPVPIQARNVTISPANSKIGFVGTHEGDKPDPRTGGFKEFFGKAIIDSNGIPQSVVLDVNTPSLWTDIPKLTAHLKSPDFFDVREHPRAKFASISIKPTQKENVYDVEAEFTLLGVAKKVIVPAKISVSDDGMTIASEFILDRTEFGMTYGIGKVKKDVIISIVVGQATNQKRP